MSKNTFDKLITLEMANNHMGDLEHGIKIIESLRSVSNDFPDFGKNILFHSL